MQSKLHRNFKLFFLFLWLDLQFVDIHCMSKNDSLDSIPVSVFRQQTKRPSSCFERIYSHIGERNMEICKKIILYPRVKTLVQDQKICFTQTPQDIFSKVSAENTSVADCQILHKDEIINIVNVSCEWLPRGFRNLDEDQKLMSMVIGCETKQLCLIIAASGLSGNERMGEDNCLSALPESLISTKESKKTSIRRPTSQDKTNSDKNFFIKNLIPILAIIGGLFIIIVIVTIYIRIQNKNTESTEIELEPAVSSQQNSSSLEGDYCEPDVHTRADLDENDGNYAYPYGHLGRQVLWKPEHGKKHNYVNITANSHQSQLRTQAPLGRSTHSLDKTRDYQQDYEYMNGTMLVEPDQQDYTYMNGSNDYASLNRSSMVDDDAQYQGLKEVRPKVAPRPKRHREEKAEVSYVKVL